MRSLDFKMLIMSSCNLFLPLEMRGRSAWALMYAIALQVRNPPNKTEFKSDGQGYWDLQSHHVAEAMTHIKTKDVFDQVILAMELDNDLDIISSTVKTYPTLEIIVTRLVLFTSNIPLPVSYEITAAWDYYNDMWFPENPNRSTWAENYAIAWNEFFA